MVDVPESLDARVRSQIRRGIQIFTEMQGSAGDLRVDSVYFRVFLGGRWSELAFDGNGDDLTHPT